LDNHLRAILDLPLGSTAAVSHVAMVNFIGGKPENEDVLKIPNAHLHLYGKAPRKGRKIAHATIRTKSVEELEPLKKRLIKLADDTDDS
jgi:5-(carboxyamino)imidazole ribonucleotide synthase